MDSQQWQAEQFEQNRKHLRAVAQRMLGSTAEADDAVQEAWLRLSRSDAAEIQNMRAWLTTVVSRICLDMLRARQGRREDLVDEWSEEPSVALYEDSDPEYEALIADSVGLALMVVLDTLSPAERLAFVLHDMFGVPFEEIGPIVDRNAAAARQLASRARRRVRGASEPRRGESRSAAQGRRGVPGGVAERRLRCAARGARSRRGVPGPGRRHRATRARFATWCGGCGDRGSRARCAVRSPRPAGDRQRQAGCVRGAPRSRGVAGRVHDRRRPRDRDGPTGGSGQAPARSVARPTRRLSAARPIS